MTVLTPQHSVCWEQLGGTRLLLSVCNGMQQWAGAGVALGPRLVQMSVSQCYTARVIYLRKCNDPCTSRRLKGQMWPSPVAQGWSGVWGWYGWRWSR